MGLLLSRYPEWITTSSDSVTPKEVENLERITNGKARYLDSSFAHIAGDIEILSDYTRQLFKDNSTITATAIPTYNTLS